MEVFILLLWVNDDDPSPRVKVFKSDPGFRKANQIAIDGGFDRRELHMKTVLE
jgi:hypothetical protein